MEAIQKEFEFDRDERDHVEFHGSWLLALEISMSVTQFCGISTGKTSFCPELSKVN